MFQNDLKLLSTPQSSFFLQWRQKSLHLEPILQFVAVLTQGHCSPWKNCALKWFAPKSDS